VVKYHGQFKYIFDFADKYKEEFKQNLILNEKSGIPENRWFPPYSYLVPLEIKLYDNKVTSEFKQYTLMFYSSAMMLGLENEGPVNVTELIYIFFSYMLSSLAYNFLFSEISIQINSLEEAAKTSNIHDYFDAI